MSGLRAAPGVFELKRSNSFQEHKYSLGHDDEPVSQSDAHQESDYEEEVDESVREDMRKLEDTFPGILSLIHISEPTRRTPISYAVFCLKKKSMPSSAWKKKIHFFFFFF